MKVGTKVFPVQSNSNGEGNHKLENEEKEVEMVKEKVGLEIISHNETKENNTLNKRHSDIKLKQQKSSGSEQKVNDDECVEIIDSNSHVNGNEIGSSEVKKLEEAGCSSKTQDKLAVNGALHEKSNNKSFPIVSAEEDLHMSSFNCEIMCEHGNRTLINDSRSRSVVTVSLFSHISSVCSHVPYLSKQNKFQVKIVISTDWIVGLA